MESYLISGLNLSDYPLAVEGWHKPGSLTRASGLWLSHAGIIILDAGDRAVRPHDEWVWLAVEEGEAVLHCAGQEIRLGAGDTCFLPCGGEEAALRCEAQIRCIWVSVDGPLGAMFVRKMGALPGTPLRQVALPSQLYLGRQIVQVMVRHSGTGDATYQLQHLMYGMLASHWGHPVAMDAMLSHEIAKVVDTLRANGYRDNFSLAEMAAISRMPLETFRKRFVSEVGMPPLSYVLHCKMEKAKELLLDEQYSVREAGAEVGMKDPYHFSKQFKNIVGISPTAFVKQAAGPGRPVRRRRKKPAEA